MGSGIVPLLGVPRNYTSGRSFINDMLHWLQVGANNWVRRIAGEKRIDRRRMDELREETGL